MGDGDCEPPLSESGGYFVKDILVLGDGHLIASDPVLAPGIRLLLEQSRSESLGATVLRWSLEKAESELRCCECLHESRRDVVFDDDRSTGRKKFMQMPYLVLPESLSVKVKANETMSLRSPGFRFPSDRHPSG